MKIEPSYRVVANRFFREQWSRKKALRARIDEIWKKDWKKPPSGKGSSQTKFATDYEEALRAAGAFQFTESGVSNGVQKGPPIGVEEGPPFRII